MYADDLAGDAKNDPRSDAGGNQADVVAALRRPDSYPDEVRRVDVIETHMSWVFLTEHHVYKLKKAVQNGHVDHRTALARRRSCDNELMLNRRLSPDVYLAVVPLASDGERLRIGALGAAVDWLVQMRRLPGESMLDACIARGAVRPAELDMLAESLGAFYARCPRAGWSGVEYRSRLGLEIDAMQGALATPRYALPEDEITAVARTQRRWLELHAPALEARAERVVEAHGDLRPEHVCLAGPVVIDCLDFARDLRLLDPVSELAFLALECRRLGAGWVGEHVLGGYARVTSDRVEAPLVRFYQCQHALVRAAVAIWHLDQGNAETDARWRERARLYLRLALELAAP